MNQLGNVCDSIFDVKVNVVEKEIGVFKKVWGGIAWMLNALPLFVFGIHEEFELNTLVSRGPCVGSINYSINLLKDSFFVVECKIE